MSAKQFFKSTAFKCIAVLVSIVLICGIFLTFMYSLLAVSDEEREGRGLVKIYGKQVNVTKHAVDSDIEVADAQVNKVFLDEYGDYLLNVTGFQGYDGGNVTCWVLVDMEAGKIAGIKKVAYESNVGQSYIDRANKPAVWNAFSTLYKDDVVYKQDMLSAATTVKTKTAICNSVNGALSYVKYKYLGVSAATPYDEFYYLDYINKSETSHTVSTADQEINYTIVTGDNNNASSFTVNVVVGFDGLVKSVAIAKNGSTEGYETFMATDFNAIFAGKNAGEVLTLIGSADGKYDGQDNHGYPGNSSMDSSLTTGASESNFLVSYATLFAVTNYKNALALGLANTQYIDMESTTYTVESDVATYSIVTKGNNNADVFNLTVVIAADGTVSSIDITKNGSTEGYGAFMATDFNTIFAGKNAAEVLALIGTADGNYDGQDNHGYPGNSSMDSSLTTGASESNFLVAYATYFAASNYDLVKIIAGGNN